MNLSRAWLEVGTAPAAAEPVPEPVRGVVHLAWLLLRRWRLERSLRARAIELRSRDPDAVRIAYEQLSAEQFAIFNALQDWTHRRVIPRVVSAVVPRRACVAVDLGCGSGDSTRWLTRSTARGSRVLAYDFSAQRLATARGRDYHHADGSRARVAFVLQEISQPLRDPDGQLLPHGSVDVALSSGVVGHHLDAIAVARLARELQRVLRADGAAVLDAGPQLRVRELAAILARSGFRRRGSRRLAPFNSRAQVVFRRR